ncbi:MAG: NDP-sugar synthase [Nanoarchaeota archaeon]|nr:NDP-sugar synthase [Nanoarchaeota archaeon]MBU1322277.1 NDP-sugar synthase [Nanoarchaeota archaeon]MBU1598030.1 NDP-sugar synthase [Nanoarchaeota archaeon]MBU2441004.1 NDP-sugar synthase [Nanoarchaeota archaeon]
MKVIIPIAGVGTRLFPLTYTKHKALLLVAGKPGLDYILDELKEHDVSEIIFITGYLKEQIEEYVIKKYPDFKFRFIEQKVRDGTAGAVKLTEPYVDEPIFLVYADAIFDTNLSLMNKLKDDEDGLIWVQTRKDWNRMGVCVLNKEGYLTKFVEKPKEFISDLCSIGVYYIKDYKALFEGIKHIYDNKITIKGEYYVVDAMVHMIKQGAKFKCPEISSWHDFGVPATLLETNRIYLDKGRNKTIKTENSKIIPPVHIADGAKIKNSEIGPYVTIAKGVEINNSTVKDSIIDERTKIIDAFVEKAIIGEDVQLTGKFKELMLGDHSVVVGEPYKK